MPDKSMTDGGGPEYPLTDDARVRALVERIDHVVTGMYYEHETDGMRERCSVVQRLSAELVKVLSTALALMLLACGDTEPTRGDVCRDLADAVCMQRRTCGADTPDDCERELELACCAGVECDRVADPEDFDCATAIRAQSCSEPEPPKECE